MSKESKVENVIALSGTPIKNHALEYFPILNLLRPDMFPDEKTFTRQHVGWWIDSKGKYKPGGIRYPQEFKQLTEEFIVRRTREEVAPDLPTIQRDYQYYEMGQDVKKAYNQGVKKLDNFLRHNNENSTGFYAQLHGHLMVLWHITGLSKTEPILEFCQDFLESNDEGKIALFHHHVDVGDTLEYAFRKWGIPCVRVVAQRDKPEDRPRIFDKFRNDPEIRFSIAPTLASGEGIDLEFCKLGILCEREWNPANEEQVEGRFTRATEEMMKGGKKTFSIIYPVALGTVDEFFSETVERKRVHVNETMTGRREMGHWNQSEVMMEIAKRAIKGMKK